MKRMLLAATASVFALAATPVFAQASADEAPADGDIIVTATRSETLLSKTPLAITAITGDSLRDKGIVGPTGLAETVPNLSIDRTNGLQITIRGVTSTDGTEKGNPSAAFLIDGIYQARPQMADIGVEVLRGPQGTLYGKNTTAGAINVITNKPEIGKFGAGINVGYGNYSALNADGYVNIAAGDMAAFRIAATFDQRDNWVRPALRDTGTSLDPFRKNFSVRASALVKLGDNGDLLVRGTYGHLGGTRATSVQTSNFFSSGVNDANGSPVWSPIAGGNSALLTRKLWAIPVNTSTTGGGGVAGSTRPYQVDNSTLGVGAELNYDLGFSKVTYIGSYNSYKANENTNLDINGLLPANLPGFLAPFLTNFTTDCKEPTELCSYPAFFNGKYTQTSHELRFAFGGDGPFKLQAGGYYFREHSVIGFWIPDFPAFIIGNNKLYGFPQETTSKTIGAFAQGTFEVSDGFRLTAGGRYTKDNLFRYGHTVATNNINSPIVIGGSTYANDARVKNNKFTWKVGFDADVGRGLLYGNVATGYKQGGFGDGCSNGGTPGNRAGATLVTSTGERCDNSTLTNAALPYQPNDTRPNFNPALYGSPQAIYYQPETLRSYEIGYRGPIMPGLRIDTGFFYYDYKNMQLSSLLNINGAPTLVTTNAGKSAIKGFEFEAIVNPAPNHQFNFGFDITDAKYKHFCPGGTGTKNPLDACTVGTIDYRGRTLDRTPKHVAFARYAWTIPMGDSEFVLSAGTQLKGKYSITQFGSSPTQRFTPSHTYNGPDGKWYVQGFVKNIENFLELRNADGDTVVPSDPRTFGIRAGFKY
jgi:iron complex outermembrane recepter protein